MKAFEDLRIWQDAQEIAIRIYSLFKGNTDYGFRDQIQRAAVSISNNIAEGSEYNSDRTMIRYLKIANGCCSEVASMLYLLIKIGSCNEKEEKEAKSIIDDCKFLSNSIGAFISYLERNYKTNIQKQPRVTSHEVTSQTNQKS